MTIEIEVLSGAQRGMRHFLEQKEFRVGGDSRYEIAFDPQLDPSAKDRTLHFRRTADGWFVRSSGSGEVLLNQTPIAKEVPIRSGDLVRLSELGPDFSFAIVSQAAAVAHQTANEPKTITKPQAATPCAEAKAEGPTEILQTGEQVPFTDSKSQSRSVHPKGAWKPIAAVAAIAALGFTAFSMFRPGEQMKPAVLEQVSAQNIDEGSELTVQMRLKPSNQLEDSAAFNLIGQPPQGATIDMRTGVFRWSPTETQGPGVYQIQVGVRASDSEQPFADTSFRVEVKEVNSPPVIRPIGEKTLKAGQQLAFSVEANDPDQPANQRSFKLLEGPDWVQVDRDTGVVRCSPPASADGRFQTVVWRERRRTAEPAR